MEDELDLMETIRIIWRGRYIIAAVAVAAVLVTVLFSFFTHTPLYEASAAIDTAPYDFYREEMEHRPDDYTSYLIGVMRESDIVDEVAGELGGAPALKADAVSFSRAGSTHLVRINASGTDPAAVNAAVEWIGLAALELARGHVSGQLASEESSLNESLAFFKERIDTLYGEGGRPRYFTDEQGNYLDLDPFYRRIMEEKADIILQLNMILFEQRELAESPPPEQLLSIRSRAAQPVNPVRWPLLVAASALLGLVLSAAIVLARHHLATAGKSRS